MLTALKPHAEKALQPIGRLLRHVNPNTITLFGLLTPVLFFVLLVHGLYWWALVAIILNALDMLDGLVARMSNRVSAFGGLLDSTIDRVADFTIIAAFGFAGITSWRIILPLLMLTYLISYIRSRTELAAKGNLVASVGIMERTERFITIFIGLLLYAIFPRVLLFGQNVMSCVFVVLIILSFITVLQRFRFAYKKL